MLDFTLEKHEQLTHALLHSSLKYTVIHDVDLRPEYSLRVARMEAHQGMKATYYFRSMHFTSHTDTIKAIVALGHRAGYHYECLTTTRGNIEAAYEDFCNNLEKLRKIVPVTTACAHGSPRSPWNSQIIWETSRLRDLSAEPTAHHKTSRLVGRADGTPRDTHSYGIEYEPMLDTDFSKTLYLTDTGRRWDGYKVSVRDKVPQYQEQWEQEGLVFHSTNDIIHALNDIHHPIHQKELLINTHPQRWMPFGAQWMMEASSQWWKNQAKRLIVLGRR